LTNDLRNTKVKTFDPPRPYKVADWDAQNRNANDQITEDNFKKLLKISDLKYADSGDPIKVGTRQ
jgi:hypothetical protein